MKLGMYLEFYYCVSLLVHLPEVNQPNSNGKSQRKGILADPDLHQHGMIEHRAKDQLKLEFRGYLYKAARVANSVKIMYKKMHHSVV